MFGRAENIVGLGGCIHSQCLDHAPPQSREGPTAIVSPPGIVIDHCCLRGPKLRPDPLIPESHPHRAGSQFEEYVDVWKRRGFELGGGTGV